MKQVEEAIQNSMDIAKMVSNHVAHETDKRYQSEQKKYEQEFRFVYQVCQCAS